MRGYLDLMKLRVVELLLVSTLPAMVLAAKGLPGIGLALATICAGTLAAGSANAFNMVIESDLDKLMARTAKRPIVTGLISKKNATVFATSIGIISLVMFWIFTTPLATLLALIAIVFYVVVYTMTLKQRTAQNIVWGGAAGCMPVLIGWAAVTNSLSQTAWAFFFVIFFWTPPHFWALALYRVEDYRKSGLPMLPVTHGSEFTRLQILLYTIVLGAACLLPFMVGMSGWLYLVAAVVLSIGFVGYAIALMRAYSDALARQTFRFSLIHLSVLFAALLLDHYVSI